MLEKIGLPAKPSLRGNSWVVDASHCQSCASLFTFINRKHHCRRCGGLFCSNCTVHRMVLRGQGESPVRICDPCKQLEEAARFALRHSHRTRGIVKLPSKHEEDDILSQILGNDTKELPPSRQGSIGDVLSINERASGSSSHSTSKEFSNLDEVGEMQKTISVDQQTAIDNEMVSTSPEELRQRAMDEKKRYKVLKGEGKSNEALKAFKRGKELERQADALEISLRKNRRKVLPTGSTTDVQNKDNLRESGRRSKLAGPVDKDDFLAELKELGWSDMGSRDDDKKPSNMSLEGELSLLTGELFQTTVKGEKHGGIDKSQVVALKKKALALKREGKLAEAKEELKKAKVLEKQLEEEELLGAAEDSDDEISALIRSIGDNEQDELLGFRQDHGFDFDHLAGTFDNIGGDANIEVTDDDLVDPEIAATLKSLGWDDDHRIPELNAGPAPSLDRGGLSGEILSLKREALNQKQAGNAAQAMALLKKAKLLERDLGSLESDSGNLGATSTYTIPGGLTNQPTDWMDDMAVKPEPKSRSAIQKELLALKKKALALRREGRGDEAEEELKKGKVLEQQLEEMENGSKVKATQVAIGIDHRDLSFEHRAPHVNPSFEDGEDDVTDRDMHDPAYLSMLRTLGWEDDDSDLSGYLQNPSKERVNSAVQIAEPVVNQVVSRLPARKSKRSKAEIQRELLGLKRKALALRREGNTDDAEEVLKAAKGLEAEIAELEEPKKEMQVDSISGKVGVDRSPNEEDVEDVTKEDMHDPAMIVMPKNFGWHNEDIDYANSNSALKQKSKQEIQRELFGPKRNALSHRRIGEIEVSEDLLEKAKVLESQSQEIESLKVGLLPTTSKDATSDIIKLLTNQKTQSGVQSSEKSSEKLAAVAIDQDELHELFIGVGRKEYDVTTPFAGIIERIVPDASHNIGDKPQLFGESGFMASTVTDQGTSSVPPTQSANIMDLLTGDGWSGSHIAAVKHDDTITFKSNESLAPGGSLSIPFSDVDGKQESGKIREEKKNADTKQLHVHQMNSAKLLSDNNENSIQQEVLARKRKAVALKREGKLAEAREELRQAKLLEKTIGEGIHEPETGTLNVSTSTVSAPVVQVKEPSPSKSAVKPLSGRDRFKLQQESLSHKRQALKLRREGRTEEADAELELAKALEAQLEDLASLGPAKEHPVDDVVVEDLLDPQLLSALQAIGIQGANEVPRIQERPKILQEPRPLKVSPGKGDTSSQERSQLEERIKTEKVKALHLKRSGQQAEALDALRQAKLLEKKLNALK